MTSFKQELNKKQKIIVFGIIGLCVVFADLRLLIGPWMKTIKTVGPKVSEAHREFAFAKDAATNIPKYRQQIAQYNDKLSLQKKRFSTNQEISSLLQELSTLAKNTDVKIVAVKPHPPIVKTEKEISEGAYKRFPISVRAVCGYHQLGAFLNNLENARTFMRVSDIRISTDSKNITGHQVYLLVSTYILSGEEAS